MMTRNTVVPVPGFGVRVRGGRVFSREGGGQPGTRNPQPGTQSWREASRHAQTHRRAGKTVPPHETHIGTDQGPHMSAQPLRTLPPLLAKARPSLSVGAPACLSARVPACLSAKALLLWAWKIQRLTDLTRGLMIEHLQVNQPLPVLQCMRLVIGLPRISVC